jgi:hypothetical protein
MARVLKLKTDNERKEIEFELRYLVSLTVKQRFQLMFRKIQEILRLLKKSGQRRSFEVIKRT